MITSPAFSGKKYAVLGLARSGLATVRALLASGASVIAWDKSETARAVLAADTDQEAGGRLVILDFMTFANFEGVDAIIVSPGVPLNRHPITEKARQAAVPVIGDVELFAQARPHLPPHRVVGITGTNGKSTTTALVHHMLETAEIPATLAGNIGYPILARDPLEKGGVYVLELSSYQLDLTYSLDCDVVILLNITPDHLDRYNGDFRAYVDSKQRLLEMQSAEHAIVIAGDDSQTRRIAVSDWFRPHRELNYWLVHAADARGQSHWPNLQGPHNAQNAVAATAAAQALGLPADSIERALRTFPGLPHRMELVAERNGVRFVNDSKATNPDSAAPALAAFPKVHWILGGLPKGDDLGPCEAQLDHVRAAYTIGEAGPMFARLLEGKVPVKQCEMLIEAVQRAADAAVPGEVVLLSPACASFDQFRDYEARGEAFRAAVDALGERVGA